MKLSFSYKILKFIFLPLLFISCSSDLDFNQVNDLKLEPVFVANLAYFNLPANQFVDNGMLNQIAFDEQDFNVFRNQFFKDNLVKSEFNFEIENTITRGFTMQILLLNANDTILDTMIFEVPAYSGSSNVVKYPTEVFENDRLTLLKQSTKIGFLILMKAGTPIDQNSPGNLKLRSSATVYMEIKK